MGKYIHRYEHVEMMQAKGIAVVGYDRRSHGQSGGKRGHTLVSAICWDETWGC
ncbi:MAG: hypothetical protein R2795_05145 [Saprospiraceae bacterium]